MYEYIYDFRHLLCVLTALLMWSAFYCLAGRNFKAELSGIFQSMVNIMLKLRCGRRRQKRLCDQPLESEQSAHEVEEVDDSGTHNASIVERCVGQPGTGRLAVGRTDAELSNKSRTNPCITLEPGGRQSGFGNKIHMPLDLRLRQWAPLSE